MDNELNYAAEENDEEFEKALGFDAEEKETDEEENKLIVEFKKPFVFEGETYTELNLEGLEELTGADLAKIDRAVRKKNADDLVPEMSLDYALALAARATGQPIEFFKALPLKDCRNVRNKVRSFLFN
jgi:hypothetical protein